MMDNKVYYTDLDVEYWLNEIIRSLYFTHYKPDYIVGLSRGGLIPAVKLSHYLDIPMYPLCRNETNCWMAEDAYNGKKILIVDDINDTGSTFNWVKEDWEGSAFTKDEKWNDIWHDTVRFASLIDNQSSEFDVDYSGKLINKVEKPEWCVFPWEYFWAKNRM